MPALVRRGPFSYDSLSRSGTNNYTLTNAAFDADNGEILEVIVDGVKIEGDGTADSSSAASAKSPAHGFYVDSLTAPTIISLVSNGAGITSVKIYRLSNRSSASVDFAPGSVIRETDLDNSTNQTLHVAQEAMDIALTGVILDNDDKWNASSKVIKSVADGAADNDAVNKGQLTATEVATLAYKEDTEDYKLESADWANKVNGAVNPYTDNVAGSGSTSYSAKAHAVGGTGVDTATGSAKDWATKATTPSSTATDASAKEWATGVSTHKNEGSAKDWATYTAGDVRGASAGSMSSKEWAVGIQGRTVAGEGSAKDWATLPVSTGTVDNASYSAKEYSQSTTAGTSTYGGSAKGWSQTAVDTAVPGAGSSDRSALHYSTAAANSATSAKASAAAVASTFDSFDDTYLGSMADGATATDADTTGTWAINSNVITVASATNIIVGQEVTGAGGVIPTDANVIAVAGTSITISENMTAAGSSVDLDFRGQGVYGAFNVTKDGPATDNDGGALANGMLYFNTTDNSMKVYKETGAAWIKTSASGGVSLVMHKAVASGTPTSFAASDFTPTLSYEVNNIVVWLNGVKLDSTDFTATTGTTITGLAALANADELVVLAFKTFEVGDAVSAASGGTFGGAVTCSAGLTGTTIDATTDFTIGGTVITNNTITDDGTLTITATTGITLGQDTALSAGKDLETSTTGKIKQKGSFMQSSTHQALTLGY